jgi:glucose/arabinose dehydrogenase
MWPRWGFLLFLLAVVVGGSRQAAVSAPASPAQWPAISVVVLATGFNQPTAIANGGDYRLFVAERTGLIRIVERDGSVRPLPFLDITNLVFSVGHGEQGLLGLAFHPDYPQTPYFYLNYTAVAAQSDLATSNGATVVARFTVSDDPHRADPASKLELLTIPQPAGNHNGGDLQFGPDGYLYVATGDGGSGGDPWDNAQNRQSLLGKILRLDVNSGAPYAIPSDNPFVGDAGTLDEIWALGLRNPWRLSFDRQQGDLFIADVGQNAREEVNFQPATSAGGENYGWRCYEGNAAYNLSGCGPTNAYVFPMYDYPHTNNDNPADAGQSITGGFVYRGSQFPALTGHYIFADFVRSHVWLARPGESGWVVQPLGTVSGLNNPSTFGEGCDGELYVAGYGGTLFQVRALPAVVTQMGAVADDFLLYLPLIRRGAAGGLACD